MKYLLIIFLLTGCETSKIYVSKTEVPILIEKDGCFVTKSEYIKLINNESIKYYNGRVGKYYLPTKLIEVKGNKVKLKSWE